MFIDVHVEIWYGHIAYRVGSIILAADVDVGVVVGRVEVL